MLTYNIVNVQQSFTNISIITVTIVITIITIAVTTITILPPPSPSPSLEGMQSLLRKVLSSRCGCSTAFSSAKSPSCSVFMGIQA